ncbi:MAG: hypothetical protein IJY03_04245 [Prevotella sp.]|nr:hypothetical protein [Prevotella sp.]
MNTTVDFSQSVESLSKLGKAFSMSASSVNKAAESMAELGRAVDAYSQEEMRFRKKRRKWWLVLIALAICFAAALLVL